MLSDLFFHSAVSSQKYNLRMSDISAINITSSLLDYLLEVLNLENE